MTLYDVGLVTGLPFLLSLTSTHTHGMQLISLFKFSCVFKRRVLSSILDIQRCVKGVILRWRLFESRGPPSVKLRLILVA